MSKSATWQEIVASALDWDQAHVTFDGALKGLAPGDRGKRPDGFPHSVWELVEHFRITQHDLLDFCRNPDYSHNIKWPDDYWPSDPAPPNEATWEASLAMIRSDRKELKQFTISGVPDLTAKIPHGTGQTYLRTVLVAIDHAAYHVAQIVDVRRLIGSWEK
jgi:hypothetical protein